MDKDKIFYKSIPIYWKKEQIGLKRNTIRDVEEGDGRIKTLRYFEERLDKEELWIVIINTETKEKFERLITDIFFTNKNQVLISWK